MEVVVSSDFHNLKDSGKACVGCGVTGDRQMLCRLDTYSLALGCYDCFIKHKACSGVNPEGKPCNHEPHLKGPCRECGCPVYRHGLTGEFDRQLEKCVGLQPRAKECQSYGANLGKCGRIILATPDGTIARLCPECEKSWVQEVQQGMKEVSTLLDLDTNRPQ